MAVEFLHELDVPFFKVASCDANNFPYLEKTAKKGTHCTTYNIESLSQKKKENKTGCGEAHKTLLPHI